MIQASSCDPSVVPGAIAVAATSPSVSKSFVLQVPILMYHRIVPESEAGTSNRSLVVPPSRFAAQLSALAAAGWQTITLAGLADDLEAGIRPPARTFVITIDDGWADGYVYALPILQAEGFVATYFVIAGRIDDPGFLTVDQIWALTAAGDEIGDHTVDHARLTRLSPALLTYEIDAGAATIASITGRWPETLAYPYGQTNPRVEAAVQACGMKLAVIEANRTRESWATRLGTPRFKVDSGTTPAALLAYVQKP